jgi:hypothetical protein
MSTISALILVGVLAFVAAGAGFAVVQPRRFTDRDADGAPDPSPEEMSKARDDDAWRRKDQS